MNLSLLDPFQNDFPEVIEEFLEHGITKSIAFNRRGTLLAAGCADGSCVIWDFHTRGVAAELRDKSCSSPVTSVSWSKCGHHLVAAAMDKSLSCWDVAKGVKIASTTLHQTALHARFHPGRKRPLLCLACPLSSAPLLIDLSTGESYQLPLSASPKTPEAATGQAAKGKAEASSYSFSGASFNKKGDLIFVGNSKGEVLIVDTDTRQVRRTVQVPGGATVRQIVFSRNGHYVLTNSSDRVIRVFENLLPRENAAAALAEDPEKCDVLSSPKEFSDGVLKAVWKTACFSNDAEFVVAASGAKGEHKIQVWNREFGQLARMLECPKEGLIDIAWHPTRSILASVSMSGLIYIWAKDYTENWSAFAPDFRELEENEEYVEREDEFDLNAEAEKAKPVQADDDADIDITTTEKVAVFSDSDESQDNLYFLPTVPQPDSPVPEEPSQAPASPPKVQASHPSESNDSPESEEQNQIELTTIVQQSASPPEEEVGANGRIKRKRKLSEKAAELQAEIGRKSKTKGVKTKSTRSVNGGEEDEAQEDIQEEPSPSLGLKKLNKRPQRVKQVSSLRENTGDPP
ncbi:protein RBL [Selaginella moellendorffii]|uniref:protein RBL n=1 Tax=Selaginella moellendorffii TaxID=88036 RepID=UPI000D1C91E8|nr:protein RBL [Selaginella moellendorffii]|eukprot:XP_024534159.1 protein RBL [Selaginella moellendorffii]